MTPVFAVALALITFWLHRRIVRATAMPRPWSIIVDGVLVLLWALTVIGAGSGTTFAPDWARAPGWLGMVWLAAVLYLVLGLAVIAIVSVSVRIVRRIRRRPASEETLARHRSALRVATAVVVAVALGTTAFGVVEAARPQVVDVDAAVDGLPAEFDGVRVALISDLHVGPARGEEFTRRVVDEVNAQDPDLVVIAGDLTDGTVELVGSTLDPLADLSAPLGVYGVSGNHEFYAEDGGHWLNLWEDLGVTTLRNSRVPIEFNGATIDLVGIQDYTAPEPYEPDLPLALDGRDDERFALLLAHQPLQAEEASELGVDLQLSGHTHGGQLWPINYLVPLQQPSVEGLDQIGDTTLYTTRGAGAWGPPVRVGAPPEITVLTLRAE